MKNSASSPFLPTANDPRANKLLIFDCLNLFGEEVGTFIEERMTEISGINWLQDLRKLRDQHRINMKDADWVIKEALKSDSPLRQIFPKNPGFYSSLEIMKKLRNHNSHNEFDAEIHRTISAVEACLQVALDLKLTLCASHYSSAILRLKGIAEGQYFGDEVTVDQKIEDLEIENATLEEKANDELIRRIQVEKELQAATQTINFRQGELDSQNAHATLKEFELEGIRRELQRASQEAARLRGKLDESFEEGEKIRMTKEKLEQIVLAVIEQAKVSSTVKDVKANSKILGLTQTQSLGTEWVGSKGRKKLTLSVNKRELVNSRTNEPWDAVSEELRFELVKLWLEIRPSGGRIFIDDEGNVTTLKEDSLIYLGTIDSNV